MNIAARTKTLIVAAATASRPVWAFVAVETIAVVVVVVFVCEAAIGLAGAADLDQLPPWRALAVCPLAGLAARLVRSLCPIEALRRWHGVAVRRIDERWADER